MKDKAIFHKFEQPIYPIGLYITVSDDNSCVMDRFESIDGEDLGLPDSNWDAFAVECVEKSDDCICVVICFREHDLMTVKNISHESFHASDKICDLLGIELQENGINEHVAYLIGWIADCCEQVKTGIFK